jgi:ABC-2 type transport system permease protein
VARVNRIGVATLFRKEVRRYMKVPGQTILSPVVTTALYLLVFGLALGGQLRPVGGVAYLDFIVPGLIMLGVLSNAFLNSSSSLMGMKIGGTIVDLLVSPLTAVEIVSAMVGAAVTRALFVGALTWLVAVVARGGIAVAHPFHAVAFPVLAAVGMGAAGLATGIWAEKFEQLNVVPTFILTPLTFLGGVFYDVSALPPAIEAVSRLNPVFYLVDGMRYGLIGHATTDPMLGLAFLTLLDLLALALCVALLRSGWKLRA